MRSVPFQATSVNPKFQPYAGVNGILVSLNPGNYKFPLPDLWNSFTEEYNDSLYSKSWNKRKVLTWFLKEMNGFSVVVLCECVFHVWLSVPFCKHQIAFESID